MDVLSPKEQASNLRKAAGNDPDGPFAIDMIWAANTIEGLLAERDEARALLARESECLTRLAAAARELRRIEIAVPQEEIEDDG